MNDNQQDKKLVIAGVFDRAAFGYGQLPYFPRFGDRLVEIARPSAGSKVLDVATGRGALLFPAARRVGPNGNVVGVDLSAEMVRTTQAEIERQGWTNVLARRMDAENLEFPDATFDV